MIHIASKQATKGLLNFSLNNPKEEVLLVGDYYGEGPLKNLNNEAGLRERMAWLKNILKLDEEEIQGINTNFKKTMKALSELEDGEDLAVWVSNNAGEQFALAFVCYLVRGRNCNIHVYNCSENMASIWPKIAIRSTVEINDKQVQEMIQKQMSHLLTEEERRQYEQEAIKYLNSDAMLRNWRVNASIEIAETRDDALIIKHGKSLEKELGEQTYYKAVRLVGEVLAWSEYDVSDAWIEYRLQQLIKNGLFEYQGDLKEMRLYEIRLKK